MLLPERTVDIWAACAVQRHVPAALWAPTTNAQANSEPYDLSVEGPTKLLLLEHKGVDDLRNIKIDVWQLLRLCIIENLWHQAPFVFYGLPDAPPNAQFAKHLWQFSFENRLRIFTPSELVAELLNQNVHPTLSKSGITYRLGPAFLPNAAVVRSLLHAINDTRDCRLGKFVASSRSVRTALRSLNSLMTRATMDSGVAVDVARRLRVPLPARRGAWGKFQPPALAAIPVDGSKRRRGRSSAGTR
jgi:hypothetical protein